MLLLLTACSANPTRDVLEPQERSVHLNTTSCGDASKTLGSGVAVGGSYVLTAAHVVVGATKVAAQWNGQTYVAQVVLLDTPRDLALLDLEVLDLPPVALAEVQEGESLLLVDGARSGTLPATVVRRVLLSIEEVRGSDRFGREGLELLAATGPGDSGAGLFNHEGALVGLVFAVSSSGDGATWATGFSELLDFLEQSPGAVYHCRPEVSRMER